MLIKKIIDACDHLTVIETRCMKDDFVDLVFKSEDTTRWELVLSSFLGKPRKPQGHAPSRDDLAITSRTGGIRINQTLFEKEFDEGVVVAKFWPWDDGKRTTLRMALLLKRKPV
jgi:hypothetical protein